MRQRGFMRITMAAMTAAIGVLALGGTSAVAAGPSRPSGTNAQVAGVRQVSSQAGNVAVTGLAQQASGGGCTGGYPISACISGQGSSARADFYMNANPDSGWCKAYMELRFTNGIGPVTSGTYTLHKGGPFGPISHDYTTMPPSSGSVVNVVHMQTCNGSGNGTYTSPRLYF